MTMSLWTVTENPRDFPGKFVARLHVVEAGQVFATKVHMVADTLQEIRRLLPPGLARIPRSEIDDDVIVETWL